MERLWTAQEVADWLGVSVWRVYELTQDGTLPVVRIGRRTLRYDPPTLRIWAMSNGDLSTPPDRATTTDAT